MNRTERQKIRELKSVQNRFLFDNAGKNLRPLLKQIKKLRSVRSELLKYNGHCHMKFDIYFNAVGMIILPTEKKIHAMMEEIMKKPNVFKLDV